MPITKKMLVSYIASILLSGMITSAHCANIEQTDVDALLKNADLINLITQNQAINLIAQLKDPDATAHTVEDFDDFIAVGGLQLSDQSIYTEFDKDQNILQKQIQDNPAPLGVQEFIQKDIPSFTFEDGLKHVKTCMADQGQAIPDEITRIIVYKTINTNQVVYDYAFKKSNGRCQEVLYTPPQPGVEHEQCEYGMDVDCHFDFSNKKIL